MFKFKVSISEQRFTSKEDAKNRSNGLVFNTKEHTIRSFAEKVLEGRAFSCVFNKDRFVSTDKNMGNFVETQVIVVDVDGTEVDNATGKLNILWDKSLEDTLPQLKIQPTIAYESCSNGLPGKGFRFRLIWVLDRPITDILDYKAAVQAFVRMVHAPMKYDAHSERAEQQWFGNSCCKFYVTNDTVVSLDSIFESSWYNVIRPTTSRAKSVVKNETFSQENAVLADAAKMDTGDFIEKYVGRFRNIMARDGRDDCPADSPFYYFGEDDYSIRMYFERDEYGKGRPKKIRDGNHRRMKLYLRAIIRLNICPDLSLEEVLYGIMYDLYYFVDNTKDCISKPELIDIAERAYNTDRDSYSEFGLTMKDRKRAVNDNYCQKYGKSRRAVAAMKIDYDMVEELYDPNDTVRKNIERMKENGVNISEITLKRWIKGQKTVREENRVEVVKEPEVIEEKPKAQTLTINGNKIVPIWLINSPRAYATG